MVVVQSVECVEEFFLALFAFAEELNVVNNEDVCCAELALEFGEFSVFDCAYETVDEFFATVETDGDAGGLLFCFVCNGVQHVCFAEADVAIKKQRVICCAG